MKCLCLTGFSSAPQQLYSVLSGAGMAPPLPADCQPPVDIYTWHRQALELLEQKDEVAQKNVRLGRMQGRMASEIFLANAATPLWGWADEASSWLLDFWRKVDPELGFLLLFISAETAVAAHIEQLDGQDLELGQLLEAWRQRHEVLLNFGSNHPDRCLMLDADQALARPDAVIESLVAKWQLPLGFPNAPASHPAPSPMARVLARQLLHDYPEIEALQRGITSSLARLGEASAENASPGQGALIASYRALLDRSPEQEQIRLLQEQHARIDQLHQRTLGNYQQQHQLFLARSKESDQQLCLLKEELAASREHGRKHAELEVELRLAQKKTLNLDQTLQILEDRLRKSVEENELLLLQLHEVQGEFELAVMQSEALKKIGAEEQKALRTRLDQALRQLDEQARAFAERQSQLELFSKEQRKDGAEMMRALEEKLQESTEENELLLLQLHQVQEELHAMFTQKEKQGREGAEKQMALQAEVTQAARQRDESVAENHKLKTRLEQLIKALDQKDRQVIELKTELDKRAKAEQELTGQVDAARRQSEQWARVNAEQLAENELQQARVVQSLEQKLHKEAEDKERLVLQLHQVQEELEYYFLHSQEAQNKCAAMEVRLRRIQECYPDHVEFDAAEVIEAAPKRTAWALKALSLAGRDFNELNFALVIEHGMAGFVFSRKDNIAQRFFGQWPVDQAELTLLPIGTPGQVSERSAALLALSAGEWTRLLALTDFLIALLEKQPQQLNKPADFKAEEWLEGLRTLKADLDQFPAVPRFDQLRLKHQQINPDYEHLWLAFENLSMGKRSVPHFEFRLSCAAVRPDSFGQHPKLEFPETEGRALLDSWFAESFDDSGAKLELRYALPASMDLGIWRKLSEDDQHVLRMIIKHLPAWLRHLERSGNRLNRPWKDWQAMVTDIQRITQAHAGKRKPVSQALPEGTKAQQMKPQAATKAEALMLSLVGRKGGKQGTEKRKAAIGPGTERKKVK